MIFIKTIGGFVNANHIIKIERLKDLDGDVFFTHLWPRDDDECGSMCHWTEFEKLGFCESDFHLSANSVRDALP